MSDIFSSSSQALVSSGKTKQKMVNTFMFASRMTNIW